MLFAPGSSAVRRRLGHLLRTLTNTRRTDTARALQRSLSPSSRHYPDHWQVSPVSRRSPLDTRQRRWTLYSPDPDYTQLFAPAAHQLDMTAGVFVDKFPGWNSGWQLR